MGVIIAFPITVGAENVDVSEEAANEMELLAEALTELQDNLDFLRDYLIRVQEAPTTGL